MSTQAISTVQIENERTRVTEWRFAPGAATGFHRHEFDYCVVPITSGDLTLVEADGTESAATLNTGIPYFRGAGVEHDVINKNEYEFIFVEIEYK